MAVDRVLLAVAAIPWGRVATYGDVGRAVGVTPRRVGWIMARHGSSVPWWRVVSRDGVLPAELLAQARDHWDAEGIPVAPDGRGCVLEGRRVEPGWLSER